MIIAFIGPSGVGKTTLINKILEMKLYKDAPISVKQDDDFTLIKLYKRLFRDNYIKNYNRAKMLGENDRNVIYFITAVVYALIIYIEFLWDYIYYEIFFKSRILIKDRYIYDFLVTLEENLNIKIAFFQKLFLAFPKPYLCFYVDITPEEALRRNKNIMKKAITMKLEFHKKVIEKYRMIASNKKIKVINNMGNMINSIDHIIKSIKDKTKLSNIKTISISGLDGSGKTTLIRQFCDYLDLLNIKHKTVHFYHDTVLYKLLLKLGFYKDIGTKEEIYKSKRNKARKTLINGKSTLWGFLNVMDAYFQCCINLIFRGDELIIYDRYFYDFIYSFEYLDIRYREYLLKYIPGVDYSFYISCDPAILYKRKPENLKKFFVLGHEAFSKISEAYGLYTIDSSYNKPEEVFNIMLSILI